MREGFESDLRIYSEDIKKSKELEEKSEEGGTVNLEVEILSEKITEHLKDAAYFQFTSDEVQEEILEIQKKKQEIMKRLQSQISCIYDPECVMDKMEGGRDVAYDIESGLFNFLDLGDKKGGTATLGEIITDIDWGVTYNLDKGKTPLRILKKYYVEKARNELQTLLDSQIIKSESSREDIKGTGLQKAYINMGLDIESGVAEEKAGFISETMVKNFLKKISIDNPDLPFTIRDADAFQDVNQKIDFIISRKEKRRGVGVEASDKVENIGVQFSINDDAETHKRDQMNTSVDRLNYKNDRIKDIALVVFPLYTAKGLKKSWDSAGKPPGGPDKKLGIKMAEQLFKKLLEDIFDYAEVDSYWDRVKVNFK